ncbi:hypothetical protein ARMSODRAFT_1018070 [Armillaria solidipes]|uniref:Uncharacterized protein n=1 Tax=Armillaria solidipes TaxID=1076256 RepID=A0A2H3BI28_9AGAR|nr:hypothetical protein ARMSODRAFT_1018070 [Armillaria solidipes]
MSSPSQAPASQSTDNDRHDRILHLIAILSCMVGPALLSFVKFLIDLFYIGIIPLGASLSIPSSPLPVPDDDEGEETPTFACLKCSFLNNPVIHSPNKYYAVTQGWAPSILNGCIHSAAQRSLTDGIAGGHASKGSSKREAVETFNRALSQTQVKVVPKALKL